jgi:Rhs element Vgr protein
MAESPDKSGVVKLSVFSNDTKIADTWGVLSITIVHKINKIPYAKIILSDGVMAAGDFPLSKEDLFKPGAEIKINAGYGDSEGTVFKGIVIRHGIKITGDNFSRLIVECKDKAIKMTVGRKNTNFIDSKDSDIISKLIGDHGLSHDVEKTEMKYGELVQYYCSDWDFMLMRAEVNGLLVIARDGKIAVKPPKTDASPQLKVTYGIDLHEFHADIDAVTQLSSANGISWDPKTQEIVEQKGTLPSLNTQGNLASKELADVIGLKSLRLQSSAFIDKQGLKSWADAQLLKSGLSKIRGGMKFQGSAKAKPGELIELAKVGDRFNGNVFVSGVTHTISGGDWITEAEFGMAFDWFSLRNDIVAPPAAGFLPGVEGLQIGIVKKLDDDPAKENRVQVKVPVLAAESDGIWARLANLYGSDGVGSFFVPEIGDEVILGYLNNDPCHPVILGSLYSSKRKPPLALTPENFKKMIVTKSKLEVEFDDDKKSIILKTPGKNVITVSDDEKSILLKDQSGNKVELSTSGITLDSPKDITVSSKGKITIKALKEIEISATMDASLKGLNVTNEAKAGFTGKGNATAELSAAGQTTVKGAMVMIN